MFKWIEQKRKISASQKVESYIWKAVYAGHLRPRDRVIEAEIARLLGVSRGPVREALLRLERDGWIVTTSRYGAFIRDISPEEIEVTFRMRGKLEGLCVRYMREVMTPQRQAMLHKCLRKMESALAKKNEEQFFHADIEMHRTIWRLSDQPQLFRVINSVMTPFVLMVARAYNRRLPISEQYEDHKAYLEMVLNFPLGRVEREVERYFNKMHRRVYRGAVPISYTYPLDERGWPDRGVPGHLRLPDKDVAP